MIATTTTGSWVLKGGSPPSALQRYNLCHVLHERAHMLDVMPAFQADPSTAPPPSRAVNTAFAQAAPNVRLLDRRPISASG